jgi:uncharacterized protein (TIGR02266 family)
MSDADSAKEQRSAPRLAATFKVRYEGFEEFLTEYTEDLSRGGMFLATRSFLPLNSIIACDIYLPGTEEKVRIIGRVAHVLTESEAQKRSRRAGMGIEFLDIPRDDADRLLGYLSRMTGGKAQPQFPAGEAPMPQLTRKKRNAEVLVVDDQAAYLEEVALALGRAGFVVRKAQNGLVGLAQCLKRPPDLILCDVQMPQMDGWTLLRMVRARPTLAPLPFVFLTSLSTEADRLRGYKQGVDDYVTKPHDLDVLAGRLDRILARYENTPRGSIGTKVLSGDLDQVSLASLLIHLEDEKQSGVLLLVRDEERATMYLSEGRLIKCDLERAELAGADKVLHVLGWTQGRFEFAVHDVPSADEIGKPVREIVALHRQRGA